jgi:molybdate transport system regulatory protein
MKPRFNLWVEADGEVVLSAWRVRLLETIQNSGSIRAAAGRLNIPYRRAWQKVHEMEDRSGLRLIETEVGGEGGGGARLTEHGHDVVARFHRFEAGLEAEILQRYQRAFERSSTPAARGRRSRTG